MRKVNAPGTTAMRWTLKNPFVLVVPWGKDVNLVVAGMSLGVGSDWRLDLCQIGVFLLLLQAVSFAIIIIALEPAALPRKS